MRPPFHNQMAVSWQQCNSFLCVGIDPNPELIRSCLGGTSNQEVLKFCISIVDQTHDLVCAFKPQIAHFSACGLEDELEALIAYIHDEYSHIPVILDAKRGDIGSTAERYAAEVFERYEVDAVTVNPFLGWDTIESFLQHKDKGIFVLCRTSNSGSSWLQNHPSSDPLYLRIANKVHEQENPNISLVVGGTYPKELRRVRQVAQNATILVPGIGSQGGDASGVLKFGVREDGLGLVINIARAIIYAGTGGDYLRDVRARTEEYSKELRIAN